MTKKELIALLNANYKDEDTVFVQFYDDQDSCFGTIKEVMDIPQTHIKGHWEILKNGNWEKYDYVGYPPRYDEQLKEIKYRYVTEKEWTETRKCLVIEEQKKIT